RQNSSRSVIRSSELRSGTPSLARIASKSVTVRCVAPSGVTARALSAGAVAVGAAAGRELGGGVTSPPAGALIDVVGEPVAGLVASPSGGGAGPRLHPDRASNDAVSRVTTAGNRPGRRMPRA